MQWDYLTFMKTVIVCFFKLRTLKTDKLHTKVNIFKPLTLKGSFNVSCLILGEELSHFKSICIFPISSVK